MTHPFLTLDDLDLDGSKVLVRVDFNSPIDPERRDLMDDTRIISHIETLRALKDAAVVVMAHQSRPGKNDFTTLQPHARRLRRHMDMPVHFEDTLFSNNALRRIDELESGEIMLLENVRFYSEEISLKGDAETLSKCRYIRKLAPHFDIFVNDAFAAAHRAQPSTVGFIPHLPSAAGMLMERELTVLGKVLSTSQKPSIALLGGAKADDSIRIMENMLGNDIVDKVLTTGVVGNIMLLAKGVSLGKPSETFIKKHISKSDEILEKGRSLLEKYKDRIEVPTDVALNVDGTRRGLTVERLPSEKPIHDIGLDTVVHYANEIEGAGSVIVNGPSGVFELPEFAFGTEELFLALSRSKGFTVAGGGETSAVLTRMGLKGEVDHVSTGGGACITMLGGKQLEVDKALRTAKQWYEEGRYH